MFRVRPLDFAALTAGFVIIHLAAFLHGVTFDVSGLYCYWQFLDPPLLRGDLLRSVWYLHSQPPLFNLFLGGVLKLFPGNFEQAFHALFLTLSASLELSLYLLARELGSSRRAGVLGAILFAAMPATILYEHELFYTIAEAALLTLSAVLLAALLREPRAGRVACFFFVLLALSGIRSIYHPFLLPIVLLWLLWLLPQRRGAVVLGSALPVVLAVGWCIRGALLFGTLSTSSWLGMNLANNLRSVASPVLRDSLVRQHVVSEFLDHAPFQELAAYEEVPPVPERFRAVPALSEPLKAEGMKGGQQCDVNFNHYAYLDLSRRFLRESAALYRHAPQVFLARVVLAFNYYFYPASRYERLKSNAEPIAAYTEWWDRWIFGKRDLSWIGIDDKPAAWYPVLAAAIIFLPIFGLALLKAGNPEPVQRAVLGYILACIAYLTFFSLLIEVPENNRFRFSIDPFFAVLLILFCGRIWRRVRRVMVRRAAR